MLAKVGEWEKENVHSSQSFVQNLEAEQSEVSAKLDKLVSTYIDGDVPKESYLAKKEELMMRKLALTNQKEDFGRMGKNWIEPLRSWILDIQKAKKLSQDDNFEDIKSFVQKVGTNHQLLDKSASFSFSAPWDYVALRLVQSHQAEGRSGEAILSEKRESIVLWTYGESNPDLPDVHRDVLPLS